MQRTDLVIGNEYKVIHGSDYGSGHKYHKFGVGDIVTCISLEGGVDGDPQFKRKGKTQYLNLAQVEPLVTPALSWVPVAGEKYEVTTNQSAPPKSNWTCYPVGTVVTCTLVNGTGVEASHSFINDKKETQVLRIGQIKPVSTELEKAEAALKEAEDNLKKLHAKAKADAEAALKFTEADIKNLMIVSSGSSFYDLRLVTIVDDKVHFINPQGKSRNSCSRSGLLEELNATYTKTTKTLKDFANV
jgi:hypothetical protein